MLTTQIKNLKWDADYDVIVIGFGGAGATAARFAADHNCKVLLTDAAPAGHESGNTRYCGQLIAGTKSRDSYKQYYSKLTSPFSLDEKIIDTFVDGVSYMQDYLEKYLHVKPFSFLDHPDRATVKSVKGDFPDYPSYPGASDYNMYTVHDGIAIEDGALWKSLRSEVMKRLDKITIWYSSPAVHLLQNEDGRVIGAIINRNGQLLYLHAKKGVILTAGGFENDPERIQNYLGVPKIVPMGSLYNKGDSIKLSIEVGADQWHTSVFNAGGLYHGLTYAVKDGERGALVFTWPQLYTGSIFVVGNDGTRYFAEDKHSKVGYLFIHGFGRHPYLTSKSWIIFDEKQRNKLNKINDPTLQKALSSAITASSIDKLADKLKFNTETFENTFNTYNELAKIGKDYQYNRDGKTLSPLDENKIYAIELQPTALNTQGGPRRNEKAEIVRPDGSSIFGLFGAGEAGSITTNQYQAGQDVAELLIFGKIAGDNVAKMSADIATNPIKEKSHLL
ncbi:FAD-binding protein [Lactobacillus sp. HT06-2]|uniref:FAD-binding protein n=1 Tax=Lactobacillus sp. HT06-2 TaxID=2080222 RepID=UPI0013747D34|nr:FAD-binding protein [Lactobacillus sp. HT06-2]